jgi:hypothetical protein
MRGQGIRKGFPYSHARELFILSQADSLMSLSRYVV